MGLPEGITEALPLTPAQQGMLFHILEDSATGSRYNAVIFLRLSGPLDVVRLQEALTQTVNAHDALRASFVWDRVKAPLQAIHADVPLPFDVLDWAGAEDQEARLEALVQAEQHRAFDLSKAPLMSVSLIKVFDDAHVLIWTVQHLISDGWSLGVLLDEILSRYEGRAVNPPSRLRDYHVWLKKRSRDADDRFWTEHLKGVDAPMLVDFPAADDPVGEARAMRRLERGLIAEADALARRLRITQNVLLSSVWALTLRKTMRTDDVVFGMTGAGRPPQIAGIGQAVGAFVNTLPIRYRVDPKQAAQDFLAEAGRVQQERSAHDLAALSRVQGLSDLPVGSALFDTLFVHQGLPQPDLSRGGLELSDLQIRQSSNYALALLARPDDGLLLELVHDERRVAGYVADGILDLFEGLLRAIVANPDAALEALLPAAPALSAGPSYDCVTRRILDHAAATPNAIAITDGDGSINYGDLVEDAQRIAGALKAAGLKTDELVPVALPRGIGCVAAYLGVLFAGGAYVPVDLAYPPDRIAAVLEALAPRFVVARPEAALPQTSARIIDPATDAERIAPQDGSLAYVIFTSGSQGAPKGVEITREGLAYSTGIREQVFEGEPESFLLLSSLAFDSSVVGVYWTLATGGHLVIAPTHAEQDASRLGALIRQNDVTHTLCLPALYEAMLRALPADTLASLRTVIVAGEAMAADIAALHRSTLPQARLYNEYGPTEGTVWCAVHDVTDHASDALVPIGRAPPGMVLCPCDMDGVPVPDGVTGELYLYGPTVARGYFEDPVQTGQRFGVRDGKRYFRTGDLGRVLPGGDIVFLGRDDAQVKIRGHRVELGEVEAAARSVSTGLECVAFAPEMDGAQQLVLFVQGSEVPPDLKVGLSRKLASYAMPAQIRAVAEFPRLPNGKIDLSALEVKAAPSENQASVKPADEMERLLAQIWSETLGREDIGRDENFFDIGGDSLKSIGLFSLAQAHGLPMQPTDIFNHQTIEELAVQMTAQLSNEVPHTGGAEFRTAHEDGDKAAVFVLHANMWVFRNLVNGLGPRHPVGLLFSHGFDGLAPPTGTSLPALAADALERLRLLRPNGPYVICGYSAGAAIAQELAATLRANGEDVLLLSLIDPPYGSSWNEKSDAGLSDWIKFKARSAFRVMKPALVFGAEARRMAQIYAAYGKAILQHEMRAYDGPTLVQITPENSAMAEGAVLPTLLSDVSISHLPCTHDEILSEPEHSLAVARRIIARMNNV